MERNKLLRIIQKDLDELAEITQELAHKDQISKFEIDFALSKSKIVMQEFEFLKEIHYPQDGGHIPVKPQEQPSSRIAEQTEEKQEKEEVVTEHIVQPEVKIATPNVETPPVEAHPHQSHQEDIVTEVMEANIGDQAENETETADLTDETDEEPDNDFADDFADELTEEEEEEEEFNVKTVELPSEDKPDEDPETNKRIVGEYFNQGKSLNDLMSDSNKLDQKLASSPIEKLESAIGLNDRFQYIRELFNNDVVLFQSTVKQIDQMDNLKEAVGYLSNNFKWKKNDTSLKFAQLVKRRFSN